MLNFLLACPGLASSGPLYSFQNWEVRAILRSRRLCPLFLSGQNATGDGTFSFFILFFGQHYRHDFARSAFFFIFSFSCYFARGARASETSHLWVFMRLRICVIGANSCAFTRAMWCERGSFLRFLLKELAKPVTAVTLLPAVFGDHVSLAQIQTNLLASKRSMRQALLDFFITH